MTLKKLGAVYDDSCADKGQRLNPTDVVSQVWTRMLATKSPIRTGSPEDHADTAWMEAMACSEAEGLNQLRETNLPYKA
eukprot:4134797-Heterocapsa_arctica.AAC.1